MNESKLSVIEPNQMIETIKETFENKDIPTLVFSLKMSKNEIVAKLLGNEANIDYEKIVNGNLDDEMWSKLFMATEKLNNAKIYIEDTKQISLKEFEEICAKEVKHKNIGLVIIDNIQLIKNTVDTDIVESLQKLAEHLNIQIIVVANAK